MGNVIPADCHNNAFSSKLMYKTQTNRAHRAVDASTVGSPTSYAKKTTFTQELCNDSMSSPVLKQNGFSITENDMMYHDSGLWTYKGIQGHAPIGPKISNVNGSTSYSDPQSTRQVIELQHHREFLSPTLSRRTGFYNRFANDGVPVVKQRRMRERAVGVHSKAALAGGEEKMFPLQSHGSRRSTGMRQAPASSRPATTNFMLTPR